MGFYLESGKDITYISDSYLRHKLLNNNNKVSEATYQLLKTDENALILKKLGVEIPIVSIDEILKTFTDILSKDNIEKLSVLLNFNRIHLLSIFYLYYFARISIKDIEQIISASSYQTRSELLLSYFKEQDSNSINIITPLLELIRKLSDYKNKYELSSIGKSEETVLNKLKDSKIDSTSYVINQGNYFYENFNRNDGKSLLEKCDYWNGINLPDDNESKRVFLRSERGISSFETMTDNLGNGSYNAHLLWLNESHYNAQKIFNSDAKKYEKVATANLRFGTWWKNWWKSKSGAPKVTIGNAFTANTINVNRGRVEEDTISTLLGNQLSLRYSNRLSPNKEIGLSLSESTINETIKEAFRVNFNHGLRMGASINNNITIKNFNDNVLFSDTIINIFSIYDSIVSNDDLSKNNRKRYYRVEPAEGEKITSTRSEVINTNLHLSGEAVGTANSGYIDLFEGIKEPNKVQVEIANSLSNITNVKYKLTESGINKENLGLGLENHYFIKNHLSCIPFDFDFKTDNLNFESFRIQYDGNKSISSLLEDWVDFIRDSINMARDPIYLNYSMPKFYNLSHLFKYDYLIDDNKKILNFGTTDFYNAIINLLNQNNISTQFNLVKVQNDPYGVVNLFKSYVDNIDFVPSSNDEKFITSLALDILKKYIDYLLDSKSTDIESSLIVGDFYFKVYKLLFIYRHSILLLPEIRSAISNSSMYKTLMDDPFRDKSTINRIENFYERYKDSNTITRGRKLYDIKFSTLSDMHVGSLSNSSLLLSWAGLEKE